MLLGSVSFSRTLSRRLLVVVVVSSVVGIFLRTLLDPSSYLVAIPPFEIVAVGSKIELSNDPVVLGDLVELDPELAQKLQSAPGREHREPQHRPLGNHTITSDGFLVVNPEGPHPIFQLIHDAEAAWEEKLARASKTLDEAVAEYKRRYRRAPPLGFDKWWNYVIKHDVQLPDEYDEIYEDIEPFWGIDPAELTRMQEEHELLQSLVIVQKTQTNPRLEVVRSTLPEHQQFLYSRVDDILELLREVELDLPPLRITFSPVDNPHMVSDWQIKAMALDAAANGTTLTRADLPPVTEAGWIQACPPESPARLHPPILPSSSSTHAPFPTSSPKSFIVSHRDTMNPCAHPSLLTVHGQFLSQRNGPLPQRTLIPQFSLCTTLLHHDIRSPAQYGWDFNLDQDQHSQEAFEGDLPWERKVDERLGWRGRSTGIHASPDTLWVHGQRQRLVSMTNALEGNVSILRVPKNAHRNDPSAESTPVGEPETVRLGSVNPAWMDVAFAGNPIGCNQNKGTCKEMEKLWEFRRLQIPREEGQYKFIIDVDGNGWSGRFKRLVTSNALVFKATIYPEWYTSRVAPWVHYVPIQVSYADLYDAVAFFRAHDELAARIAKAGRDWSRRFWRREDLTAYMYRLLLEYARILNLDRASMDYVD